MSLPGLADYPERYQFRYCPRDATPLEVVEMFGMQRRRCPHCGWVHYPMPNLASTMVIPYQGGIVLVQRDIEPDRGIWHLPIGHIEYGEDPAQAALREGEEETGLRLADPQFLTYTHSPSYADPLLFYVVFGFSARVVGGSLTGSDEGRATRIVPLAELEELKWTSQRAAIAVYRRYTQK